MAYTKTITVYSKFERQQLHSQGIWVERNGNQVPVRFMNHERLNKLVNMLANWAMNDEGDVYQNLRAMPIFTHVVSRIRMTNMDTFQANMFLTAYAKSMQTLAPQNWWEKFL